jgi:hypothetical protein
MSLITRSAIFAGASLRNGAKVSDKKSRNYNN